MQLTHGVHHLLADRTAEVLSVLSGRAIPSAHIAQSLVPWQPWPGVLPVTWLQEDRFMSLYLTHSPLWSQLQHLQADGYLDTVFENCEDDPYGAQPDPNDDDKTLLLPWIGNKWDFV